MPGVLLNNLSLKKTYIRDKRELYSARKALYNFKKRQRQMK